MLNLYISPYEELRLDFDDNNIERLVNCKFQYIKYGLIKTIYEDYLYVFVEEMLGRLNDLTILNDKTMFGKMGKWQEYYYFKSKYNERHMQEIKIMESAVFIGTENYGIFLYEYDEKTWLEINKGYSETDKKGPFEYYSSPDNYRVLLKCISTKELKKWREQLENLQGILNNY